MQYFYHPLGDYAENYANGTIIPGDAAFPHTYDSGDGGQPHGWGKLDWGVGADVPIYAMCDGDVTTVKSQPVAGQEGYVVILRTGLTDSTGQTIYIRYLELGGLSAELATILGVPEGPGTYSKEAIGKNSEDGVLHISQGDLIGYTNSHYPTSCLHLDFTYGDNFSGYGGGVNFSTAEGVPHIEGDIPSSAFSKVGDIVTCNGEELGTNGRVPTNGGQSGVYTVYPAVSFLTCLQKPVKLSMSSAVGEHTLDFSNIICRNNMNQQAVDFYCGGTMSEKWMGKYPNTLSELNANKGIRYATAVCAQELNFSEYGNLPGVAYGKLIRAKMIGEKRSGNTMEEWFYNLNTSQFAGKDQWLKKTFSKESDLVFAQAVYKNICYPGLYGEWKGNDETLYNLILFSCSQIPIYNLHPISYGPWAYIVCYNPDTKNDKSTLHETSERQYAGDYGWYVVYRQNDGDMKYFNSKVQG